MHERFDPPTRYRVCNRGAWKGSIFFEDQNYHYVQQLYDRYVCPVAETCDCFLPPKQFHLLLRIRTPKDRLRIVHRRCAHPRRRRVPTRFDPNLQISHPCNSCAKNVDSRPGREGQVFEEGCVTGLLLEQ